MSTALNTARSLAIDEDAVFAASDRPQITLMCARFWPDRHGGVERRLWHVSRGLAAAGWPVTVVTENRTGAARSEELAENLWVRRVEPLDPGAMWRWVEWPRVRWWRRALAEQFDQRPAGDVSDVVWATDPLMAVAALLGGRGERLVYNPAGCVAAMRHIGLTHPQVTTMRRPRRLVWLDRVAYRRARCVVVSSENVRRQLERWYGARSGVNVVPHGVEPSEPVTGDERDTARRRWGIDGDAFVAGFVGRLDPCKGFEYLFEGCAGGLAADGRLLVVGGGPDHQRARRLAEQAGLADRIVWAGDLEDPRQAYAAIDALVLPSIYEAYGNVVPEAMSHGVAVLARRGDGEGVLTAADELIREGETGFTTDPHDAGDLAKRLRELAGDPDLLRAIGRRARDAAQPWETTVQEYERLLGGLIG